MIVSREVLNSCANLSVKSQHAKTICSESPKIFIQDTVFHAVSRSPCAGRFLDECLVCIFRPLSRGR